MAVSNYATRAVLLPGSGSDEVFLGRVFTVALAGVGVSAVAVRPNPDRVVASGRQALERAATQPGPLLVGGVSLGAAVAATWALEHPGRVSGLLLALPAWWGPPDDAPASALAAHSARRLRAHGLVNVLAEVAEASPSWLTAELRRAWPRQWPHLPAALEEAAAHVAPTVEALLALEMPIAVAAVIDDPVHPAAVARQLTALSSRSRVEWLTLAQLGADPAALGRAVVRAWVRACAER